MNKILLGKTELKVHSERIKEFARRAMKKLDCPARLWYYCAGLQANIRCHTAHDIPTLNGKVPETVVTGNTADISELV